VVASHRGAFCRRPDLADAALSPETVLALGEARGLFGRHPPHGERPPLWAKPPHAERGRAPPSLASKAALAMLAPN
jgi:hypothetical protein